MNKSVLLVALSFVILFGCAVALNSNKGKPTRGQCSTGPSVKEVLAAFPTAGCLECEAAVELTRVFINNNSTENDVKKIATFFCEALKIEDPNVCVNVIQEFGDFFFYLMITEALSPHLVCGIFGACEKPVYPTWNVTFPSPQPPAKPYPSVTNGPRIKVLHISDIHVDPLYTPGLQTDCGEPICCRPPNSPGTPGNSAGKFGDYACDLPPVTYENMLQYIAANFHDLSYAIFTGDMPPHDIWLETRNSSLETDLYEINAYLKYLPNITLFPAVGNHEAVPVNEFATRDIKGQWDMSWLYTPLAQMWSKWLPASALESVKYAGYYTALTPDGVRIISLNTNLGCNSENWWLTLPSAENADPDQQLHWLVKVLDLSEKSNQLVYIISHIAPGGGDCKTDWWDNYVKILVRYQNNIIASFAGHTHDDIVSTLYLPDDNSPTKYSPFRTTFFPGSVTPYAPINPGFRIYEIDAKTKALVGFTEYFTNITQANIDGKLTWKVEYTTQNDYQMADLSPASWRDMALRAKANQTMLEAYASRRGKGQGGACDGDQKCLQGAYCDMWLAPPGQQTVCGV